jgi:hypothetical protein
MVSTASTTTGITSQDCDASLTKTGLLAQARLALEFAPHPHPGTRKAGPRRQDLLFSWRLSNWEI